MYITGFLCIYDLKYFDTIYNRCILISKHTHTRTCTHSGFSVPRHDSSVSTAVTMKEEYNVKEIDLHTIIQTPQLTIEENPPVQIAELSNLHFMGDIKALSN